jgi:hypothetical protein
MHFSDPLMITGKLSALQLEQAEIQIQQQQWQVQ